MPNASCKVARLICYKHRTLVNWQTKAIEPNRSCDERDPTSHGKNIFGCNSGTIQYGSRKNLVLLQSLGKLPFWKNPQESHMSS
mmetsp:Transcript_32920/g.96957  ORF Transcript_32920/g.96957 Transcript_32920/m.96957 type:complete len:84 (-) Transcript_32920:2267-2518(-)